MPTNHDVGHVTVTIHFPGEYVDEVRASHNFTREVFEQADDPEDVLFQCTEMARVQAMDEIRRHGLLRHDPEQATDLWWERLRYGGRGIEPHPTMDAFRTVPDGEVIPYSAHAIQELLQRNGQGGLHATSINGIPIVWDEALPGTHREENIRHAGRQMGRTHQSAHTVGTVLENAEAGGHVHIQVPPHRQGVHARNMVAGIMQDGIDPHPRDDVVRARTQRTGIFRAMPFVGEEEAYESPTRAQRETMREAAIEGLMRPSPLLSRLRNAREGAPIPEGGGEHIMEPLQYDWHEMSASIRVSNREREEATPDRCGPLPIDEL